MPKPESEYKPPDQKDSIAHFERPDSGYSDEGSLSSSRASRDVEWMSGLKSGSFEAFRDIFDHYSPMLLRMAAVNLDIHSAEEIVQDVLLKLWLRRSSVEIKIGLGPYLIRSVKYRAANLIRHERVIKNTETVSYDSARQWMGAAPVSPDTELLGQEQLKLFREALDSLSDIQREVLLLRWEEGLTYREIAESLGISQDAAKQQGSRAAKEIRRALENKL